MSNAIHKIAIIDLGSGNLRSVQKAVERAGRDYDVPINTVVTTDLRDVRTADRIILPGVGAFGACMASLNALTGMQAALETAAFSHRKPLLGICVGMQMLASQGREFGETPGLGWIPGTVEKLCPTGDHICVPHMGWNQITTMQNHDLFENRNGVYKSDVYFLHSYHFAPEMKHHSIASCAYGGPEDEPFTAAVANDTVLGVQFHPEKSQQAGLKLLANFLKWTP